jgi:hypothetical protein
LKYRLSWDLFTIPDEDLTSEYNRRRSAKRGAKTGGRPVVLRPCTKCGAKLPTGELRKHQPQCQKEIESKG